MADLKNAQAKEVKVEDLLRLKRAERPDEAFWGTFDRELHQRMLQTLVKKDPWYVQFLRGVSGRIAQTVAVGAAAAFLAVLMVRPALVDFVDLAKHSSQTSFVQQESKAFNATSTVASAVTATSAASAVSAVSVASPAGVNAAADAEVGAEALTKSVTVEMAMSESELGLEAGLDLDSALTPDYQIEAISAQVEATYAQDYAHDTFEVAGYDHAAYVPDTASFAATGLATGLVY